ncbi:GNAT family N-acetyltransferase [Salimicrobium halophilum]|uniref:Ribosomal-protein-serine acetyltransferase n=1 Tax=Salimicrobium halophilum TaxID=86666 RepID=A0A1G8TST3_9BACI|nr:GNAT family protein [Salimicrobium halophilum]SDJ43770.1 ribosomal-protein-serine acetyltransferase [Salimicrobium halophilum]
MFIHKIDEEVSLRLIETRDAERVFELVDRHRLHLRTWLPWVDHTTKVEDTKEAIQGFRKGYAEDKSMTVVILYRDSVVGMTSFNKLDWTNKVAYIGYWLAEDYQGKGIMTKSAKAMTDFAFSSLKMNKVDITAAVENRASRAVPERLGFTEEGVIREEEWVNDRFVDHAVYGMLQREWC